MIVYWFFQTMSILIGAFLIERYVLLEPPMEPKKQQIFYAVSFVVTTALLFIFDEDIASYSALVFAGLNISLGRNKRRVLGFFMTIPLLGLLNASVGALPNVGNLFVQGEAETELWNIFASVVMFAALILFYFRGKKWRQWFAEKMKDRRTSASERIIIITAGVIIEVVQNLFLRLAIDTFDEDYIRSEFIGKTYGLFCVLACTLSITVVVMIMQGNKRKLYTDKIQSMQFSVISTMADIVENRDENTGGHIKRTAKYVEIIGKKLREQGAFPETLTSEYLSDMIVAAPLHDIGKIHIPDAILNKPGRLTDEEFAVMKTHAAAGRDVLVKAKKQLGDFDYINTAIEMAEYHHEWWNGKGYPNGISGEEIPLCARIMAVADVFDALTAKRCYKAAMPIEKAYGIIKEESGTHFDPAIADVFLASKTEVEEALRELTLSDDENTEGM